MIKAINLFPNSTDNETFDAALKALIPSLKGSEGFLSIQVSQGHLMSPGGPPPYSKVIEFSFDSLENMMAWTQSPEAQAQKADMVSSKSVMMYYEIKEI